MLNIMVFPMLFSTFSPYLIKTGENSSEHREWLQKISCKLKNKCFFCWYLLYLIFLAQEYEIQETVGPDPPSVMEIQAGAWGKGLRKKALVLASSQWEGGGFFLGITQGRFVLINRCWW